MRLCPSVEGSASPLITHRIGAEVCMARQRTFFHKCHRCIYRGKAANWEPEVPTLAMLDVYADEEPPKVVVKPGKNGKPAKIVEVPTAPVPVRAKGAAAGRVAKSADLAG